MTKINFTHSKVRKRLFFAKNLVGKCQCSNSKGGKPCLPTPIVRLFIFQRWQWIPSAGIDSGRILRFSFWPEFGANNLRKTDPKSIFNFGSNRSLRGHCLSKNMGKFRLDRWIAGIWTGVGFSNLKNCRIPLIRIQNSGTGVESKSEKVTPATSVIFLILWTLQPRFTLQVSARTLECLFEGVWRPQCFRTLPGLDQGWTQCPYTLDLVLYQVLRVSE